MSALADSIITGPLVFSAIPTEKASALIFVPGLGWMEWVEVTGTGAFVGYRTLRCGALEFGTTTVPRGYEADLVGGLGSKNTQASIWAWAQQQGHSVASGAWTTKVFKFADVDANSFRFPDLRDVFPRFNGTDADTALARAIGSYQTDAFRSHSHLQQTNTIVNGTPLKYTGGGGSQWGEGGTTQATGGTETRGMNTAFAPRIHI